MNLPTEDIGTTNGHELARMFGGEATWDSMRFARHLTPHRDVPNSGSAAFVSIRVHSWFPNGKF